MRIGLAIVAALCICAGAVIVALSVSSRVVGTPGPAPVGPAGPVAASPPSAPTLPYGDAPAVPRPLPPSVTRRDPCADLLTPQQVQQTLGSPTTTKRADSVVGPGCSWDNPMTAGHVAAIFVTVDDRGLSSVYENTRPKNSIWIVLPPVRGYPAVAYDDAYSDPELRKCQVSIGLNDMSTLDVGLSLSSERMGRIQPCDAAAIVADRVMETLLSR